MINHIYFNNKDLADYGLFISGSGTFNAPARNVEKVEIPGRNGSLTLDQGNYANIDVKYTSFIPEGMQLNTEGLRNFLLSQKGYKRLEDTYHPEEFRLGRYVEGIEIEPSQMRIAAATTLSFDCKPQRFLKSGEKAITFTANGTIINPEVMTALPLIRAYGSGSFTVGDRTVTIGTGADYTDIDSETQEAFYGTISRNSAVTLPNGFPELVAGTNSISFTGLTRLEITPRWWRL
jgi:phage-related protein